MAREPQHDAGRLVSFDLQPNGDVMLTTDSPEDNYVHFVLITAIELAGLAEASAVARATSHDHPGP